MPARPFSRSCALVPSTRETFAAFTALPARGSLMVLLVGFSFGCGGSVQSIMPPLAATPADFSLILSTNSVSVPQGSNSSPVNISVTGQNSFTASVQISLSGVPSGVLAMIASRAAPEREQIPSATFVPGIALHPSGALVYQPFLNGPAPPESSTVPIPASLRAGIDIFDAHSGRVRLRIFLPEPLAAHNTDTDALLRNSWRWTKPASVSLRWRVPD